VAERATVFSGYFEFFRTSIRSRRILDTTPLRLSTNKIQNSSELKHYTPKSKLP